VYQAFPSPASAEPAPTSVQRAVYLMYAGAVVSLISGIVGVVVLTTRGAGINAPGNVPQGSAAAGDIIHVVSTVVVTVAIISTVVPIVLWLWMAWKCKAGRPWARVLSTIFFALSTLFTLVTVAGSTGAWSLLGLMVNWIVGLGAIVFLWQRSSSAYFRTAPRYRDPWSLAPGTAAASWPAACRNAGHPGRGLVRSRQTAP
jgi:hypothetical protein